MAADEIDDEQDGERNTEQPQETVAASAARLIGKIAKRFHATESRQGYGACVCRSSFPRYAGFSLTTGMGGRKKAQNAQKERVAARPMLSSTVRGSKRV